MKARVGGRGTPHVAPRSQTPFGNAGRETLFRVWAGAANPRETEFRGRRSQTEFGNERRCASSVILSERSVSPIAFPLRVKTNECLFVIPLHLIHVIRLQRQQFKRQD